MWECNQMQAIERTTSGYWKGNHRTHEQHGSNGGAARGRRKVRERHHRSSHGALDQHENPASSTEAASASTVPSDPKPCCCPLLSP